MERKKKQHLVPYFLLKNFLDDEGKLWGYHVKMKHPMEVNPKNFLVKNLFHEIKMPEMKDEDSKRLVESDKCENRIENLMSNTENYTAPVVKHLVASCRSEIKNLSWRESEILKCHIVYTMSRLPAASEAFQHRIQEYKKDLLIGKNRFEYFEYIIEQIHEAHIIGKNILKHLNEKGKDYKIKFIEINCEALSPYFFIHPLSNQNILRAIMDRGIGIVELPANSEQEFLISDSCFFRDKNFESLDDKDFSLIFPVSKKKAVRIVPSRAYQNHPHPRLPEANMITSEILNFDIQRNNKEHLLSGAEYIAGRKDLVLDAFDYYKQQTKNQ